MHDRRQSKIPTFSIRISESLATQRCPQDSPIFPLLPFFIIVCYAVIRLISSRTFLFRIQFLILTLLFIFFENLLFLILFSVFATFI